jgi:uncharacterized protein
MRRLPAELKTGLREAIQRADRTWPAQCARRVQMSDHENRQLVEQAYASFKAGDIPTLLQSMSEDIIWQLPEIENVPFAGKRRGRGAVAEFFSMLASLQDPRSFEPREFIAQGDKVVVLGQYVWQVKANGRTYGGDFAHVFTVRGGQITGFHEYTDTAVAANAFRPDRPK